MIHSHVQPIFMEWLLKAYSERGLGGKAVSEAQSLHQPAVKGYKTCRCHSASDRCEMEPMAGPVDGSVSSYMVQVFNTKYLKETKAITGKLIKDLNVLLEF